MFSPKEEAAHKEKHFLPRAIADRLILEQVHQILPGRALLVLLNSTALAKHLTNQRPEIDWKIFTFEHFYLTATVNALSEDDENANPDTRIELFCNPDLPDGEYDTIIMATDAKSSSELTRDVLQGAANRLKANGRLVVSTNNPRDHWLQNHLKETFGRTTTVKDKDGVCYIARKRTTPAKQKNFDAEFAFRDGESLIPCYSRPGVFSHRRVDAGARALVRSLDLLQNDPKWVKQPPSRIVEMGCGCGSVATAVALRYPDAQVIAVDSHARAVQATEKTSEINGAENVSTILTSSGDVPQPGSHDLFLCNPPYYSDYRISELFLKAAEESLRIGGRIHLVTKQIEWHHNRLIEIFANADVHEIGDYHVVTAVAY